jgi:F420H(2)-dependent quinone reductase
MFMKRLIQVITSIHIWMYRSTGGRVGGSISGSQLLLLTTTGRKSGKQRTMPVGYFMDGSNYIISAIFTSYSSGKKPGWLYNIKNIPEVTIQVKGEQLAVKAQQADEEERNRLWTKFVELNSSAVDYQNRITEPIPMVILGS